MATGAFDLGETRDPPLAEMERAVELSRVEPDSREHADALAAYADVLHWAGRIDEARRVVDEAVAAADRSGSAAAVSRAHGTRAELVWETDLEQADLDRRPAGSRRAPRAIPTPSATRIDQARLSSRRGDLRRAPRARPRHLRSGCVRLTG